MIKPNSQGLFVIYHIDDSDGYWINIPSEVITRELSDEEFADKFVKSLKTHYIEASHIDVYFKNSENKEFLKNYEV